MIYFAVFVLPSFILGVILHRQKASPFHLMGGLTVGWFLGYVFLLALWQYSYAHPLPQILVSGGHEAIDPQYLRITIASYLMTFEVVFGPHLILIAVALSVASVCKAVLYNRLILAALWLYQIGMVSWFSLSTIRTFDTAEWGFWNPRYELRPILHEMTLLSGKYVNTVLYLILLAVLLPVAFRAIKALKDRLTPRQTTAPIS